MLHFGSFFFIFGVGMYGQALGMCLPYSSSVPAEDPLKMDECRLAGAAMLNLLKLDLKPLDIMVCHNYNINKHALYAGTLE